MIQKADAAEVAPFYHRYLAQIPAGDVLARLQQQAATVEALLQLPGEKLNFAYAPGKWTVQEVCGHLIDTERVMAYRALCLARGETQALPGFDENAYVAYARFSNRPPSSLQREYNYQRQSNLTLFASLDADRLPATGSVNGSPATVRGLITIIAAHEFHHLQILRERYRVG